MKTTIAILLFGVSVFGSQNLSAADIAAELRACASQKDGVLRLGCYDKLAEKYDRSAVAPTKPQPANEQPTAQLRSPINAETNFGAEKIEKPVTVDRITAKVAKVDERARGRIVVTLDNAQVWEQVTPDSLFSLHVGDNVTIKSGAFGSFLLIAPSNRFTNVRRVQ